MGYLPETTMTRKPKAPNPAMTWPKVEQGVAGAFPGANENPGADRDRGHRGRQGQGGLSPAAVRKVLEAELARLARCCQEAIKNGAKLPEKIILAFTVGPTAS